MAPTLIPPPTVGQLSPPQRLMLGPGPSNAHPRVYQAMAHPQVGHLDPQFMEYVDEVKSLIRYVWQTKNEFTVPVSAAASAAWEACVANLMEPGEKMLTCLNGYFGLRNEDIVSRYGVENVTISKPWGEVFDPEEIKAAIIKHKPNVVHIVHAETSTGVLQPIDGIGQVCRDNNCLLLLDTVTSTAGVPVYLDEWMVDAAYGGGQKNLACPPGISMLTFGPRAMEKLQKRKTKVANWYLDMNMIAQYIGENATRAYHHTAPISMVYALRESLRIVAEEGLEACWSRHKQNAELLYKGLEELGLSCVVTDKKNRTPSLTTIKIPDGIDGPTIQKFLLANYKIELGGGLGQLKGVAWRVGLMGYNSSPQTVALFLAALKDALVSNGYKLPAKA
eukprot:NODE_641_length_1303_cov_99.590136_g602_i0.p1 GENE.NODE_641_length_1303_cov_99.590136_g602_i0~~NODE_641_length_1303_cov_99.590136_g602_i0.p1  ORF type:complete len:391 (-),score=115.62 NODE_641_length_1303_cov_99.590136_g602_i0:26-1198(-)